MSALPDYLLSAHLREQALWSKNLCVTTSPNPLALGKWCDGKCARPRNQWSTVPAHDGGRHGCSLKTKSFQSLRANIHFKQAAARSSTAQPTGAGVQEARTPLRQLGDKSDNDIPENPLQAKDIGGHQQSKIPSTRQAQNLRILLHLW